MSDAVWTPHAGKGRPHPPTSDVYVRFRDGTEQGPGCSAFISWVNDGSPDDVMEWRFATHEERRRHALEAAARQLAKFPDDARAVLALSRARGEAE